MQEVDGADRSGPTVALAARVVADPVQVVETETWHLGEVAVQPGGNLLWGHPPGRARVGVLRAARGRRAIGRLRRGAVPGVDVAAVHRVRAPGVRAPGVLDPVRGLLSDGVWVHLRTAGAPETPLERLHRRLGLDPAAPPLLVVGGGVLEVVRARGRAAVLRVGPVGTAADPSHAMRALELLDGVPGARAPRPLGEGTDGTLAWTLEERLPGGAPRRVTPGLLDDVVDVLASLPSTDAPGGVRAAADEVSRALPDRAGQLRAVADDVDDALAGTPSVLTHGDLWLRNLLVVRGRLTGVVDWDGWCANGVPGVDLLHLVATALRARHRESLGAVVDRRPWEHADFVQRVGRCWPASAPALDGRRRQAVGLAWWLAAVAGTLHRVPQRRHDAPWLSANVEAVLRGVATG